MNKHNEWSDGFEVWRMNDLHRSIMADWRSQFPEHYRAWHDKRNLAKIAKMDVFPEETDNAVNDILARMRR